MTLPLFDELRYCYVSMTEGQMIDPANPYFRGLHTPPTAAEESWNRQNAQHQQSSFGRPSPTSSGQPCAGPSMTIDQARVIACIFLIMFGLVAIVGFGYWVLNAVNTKVKVDRAVAHGSIVEAFRRDVEPGLTADIGAALPRRMTPKELTALSATLRPGEWYFHADDSGITRRGDTMTISTGGSFALIQAFDVRQALSGGFVRAVGLDEGVEALGGDAMLRAAEAKCLYVKINRQGIIDKGGNSDVSLKAYSALETANIVCPVGNGLQLREVAILS